MILVGGMVIRNPRCASWAEHTVRHGAMPRNSG